MSANAQPDKFAMLAAEEVLRSIYGDDFQGCTANPETIANIIQEVMKSVLARNQSLLQMHAKVLEAIHRLSTPPDISQVTDPAALRSMLSERLDAINSITTQTIEATRRFTEEGG